MEEVPYIELQESFTGHSFEYHLECFEDLEAKQPSVLSGTYSFIICSDPTRKVPVMTLTTENGLAVEGNKIIIDRTRLENTLEADTYHCALHSDIDADHSEPLLHCSLP